MKSFHTTVFCVFWGAILLTSCAEENVFSAPEYVLFVSQNGAASTFTVAPTSLSFTSSGGTETISVTSNLSWTASSSESWLTLSRESSTSNDTITVTVHANTSTSNRNGRVTFSSGSSTVTVSISQSGKSNAGSHTYVDLGLPSGLLWATCNVGANSPEEYGDYFAWGETTTKSNYNLSTYKYCNGNNYYSWTKYNGNSYYGTVDNKTTLELSDDAAHVIWGGNWRMPTYEEFQELIDNCTWAWTSQGNHIGCKGTSKTNGCSIFLPAAGSRERTNLDEAGSQGNYWTSSLFSTTPWYHYFNKSNWPKFGNNYYRTYGLSIRPVCHP